MIWARVLAYITGTVDQELLLRNEYLTAENRILRAQIRGANSILAVRCNPRSHNFRITGNSGGYHERSHKYVAHPLFASVFASGFGCRRIKGLGVYPTPR